MSTYYKGKKATEKKWCKCSEFPIKHRHASFSGPIKGKKTHLPLKAKHTPTPWHRNINWRYPIYSENATKYIANIVSDTNTTEEERNANLEFIVRAVNSHDELLKIAEAYRNLLKTMAHTDGEIATFHHIESVLAQASL